MARRGAAKRKPWPPSASPTRRLAGNAVARIIGFDLAQKEAALLERAQSQDRLLARDIGQEQARDVDARFGLADRQFLRFQRRVAVALSVHGPYWDQYRRPLTLALNVGPAPDRRSGSAHGHAWMCQSADCPSHTVFPRPTRQVYSGRHDLVAS